MYIEIDEMYGFWGKGCETDSDCLNSTYDLFCEKNDTAILIGMCAPRYQGQLITFVYNCVTFNLIIH